MSIIKISLLSVLILCPFLHMIIITPVHSTDIESVNITYLDRIGTGGDTFDVKVINDIAYVTCGYFGLNIFNVSDPQNITRLGSLEEIPIGSSSGVCSSIFN